MTQLTTHLWRHSTYNPYIDLTFNQYLVGESTPVLIHTGDEHEAPSLLKALEGRKVSYIFVSHFESDECGSLATLLSVYPAAKVIASEVTARQLSGFGIKADVIVAKDGDRLTLGDVELDMIAYPSEMHLWDGLLCYEAKHKIFFSSDLMIRFGHSEEISLKSDWKEEVEAISSMQVADEEKRAALKARLASLSVDLVAPGHGPVLDV